MSLVLYVLVALPLFHSIIGGRYKTNARTTLALCILNPLINELLRNPEGRKRNMGCSKSWDAAYMERVAKTGSVFLAMISMVSKKIISDIEFTSETFLCSGNN